ncbi:Starch-binding associating with outer membrane [Fodinibius roseus]|uniref:Starch-binding associating with outer membrane n=1 Tax=Fodinibius roseus TaxID=1194090 RepID=A0A1M4SZX8_9BACT|nr:RagB/SusD family nutrient uptake outer membrane protein [Fodinibius roseus]SHE37759.1 Starch-binding associating with outer membrane [Fodinibius roseus]
MKGYISHILWTVSVLLMGTMIISSCDTDLDLTNPSYQTPENYFQNSDELQAATNAIYSNVSAAQLFAREWFFLHDLRSDEVASGGGHLEAPRRQLLIGAGTPTNNVMNDVWNGLYNVINRANVVIQNASNVEDNPSLRDRLVGEARFLRGWAYYELASLWGPVPIYTEVINNPEQFQPRVPVEKVYSQAVSDLEAAAAVLPETYPDEDRGRVTWGAAKAMLGRVFMQQLDFETAKSHLQEVVDSGIYSLTDNYFDNFKEETEFNEESIFEVVFIDKGDDAFNWGYTGDGANDPQSTARAQEYNPVAWRNLIPSATYVNNFEYEPAGAAKTDPRLGMSVYKTGDTFNGGTEVLTADMQNGNTTMFHGEEIKMSWRKYTLLYKLSSDEAGNVFRGNNHRVIRYAEVLLNMAECENETGNIPAALDYLNRVRNRASVDMPEYPTAQYPANNKMDVVEIIMHERMSELGGEEIRNRDILRWRELGYFDEDPLPYFEEGRDELLPIPSTEINNNPELDAEGISPQNPGY